MVCVSEHRVAFFALQSQTSAGLCVLWLLNFYDTAPPARVNSHKQSAQQCCDYCNLRFLLFDAAQADIIRQFPLPTFGNCVWVMKRSEDNSPALAVRNREIAESACARHSDHVDFKQRGDVARIVYILKSVEPVLQ